MIVCFYYCGEIKSTRKVNLLNTEANRLKVETMIRNKTINCPEKWDGYLITTCN